jgi:hypothetical protein
VNGTQVTDAAAELGAGALGVGVIRGEREADDGAIDGCGVGDGDGDGVGVHAANTAAPRTSVTTKRISARDYLLSGRGAHLVDGRTDP